MALHVRFPLHSPVRQRGRRVAYLGTLPRANSDFVPTTDTSADNCHIAVRWLLFTLAETVHAPISTPCRRQFACQRDPRNFWVVPAQAKEVRTNHWPSAHSISSRVERWRWSFCRDLFRWHFQHKTRQTKIKCPATVARRRVAAPPPLLLPRGSITSRRPNLPRSRGFCPGRPTTTE